MTKIDLARMWISFINKIENNVGKGQNAGHQHLLLFLQCCQRIDLEGH